MKEKSKRVLRTAAIIAGVVLLLAVLLPGCARLLAGGTSQATGCVRMPVGTSSKYMVGFDYSSYKDPFGMAPVIQCTVRYDKAVDATFAWRGDDGESASRTLSFPLDNKEYEHIYGSLDPVEIYYLNPQCSDPAEVLDGGSCWLYVYGPDDEVSRECGGFCPRNERFHEIRRTLFDNLPEKLVEVYSRYEEIYDRQFAGGEDGQFDEEFRALFDEYSQYIVD